MNFNLGILPWLRRQLISLLLAAGFITMTLLTIEQQRVIEAQSTLIHSLTYDSFSFLQLRAKISRERHPAR
jgi:hypothetical protein